VAIHEALLGARVDVPTPTGRARLRIPAGTPAGRRFRLAGHGLPGAGADGPGHLVVTIEIVVPADIDERSRQLVREFGTRNGADVRRHLFE
jgi:DnaJ-class molecular chaperone